MAPSPPVAKPCPPVAKPPPPVAKHPPPVAKPSTPVAKPSPHVAKPSSPAAKPCSHCGKQLLRLTYRSRCRGRWYCGEECNNEECSRRWFCGVECQSASYELHKHMCVSAPPLSLKQVRGIVEAAGSDWKEVLKHEGRMEALMENVPDAKRVAILATFAKAHSKHAAKTGRRDHIRKAVILDERRGEILGRMGRFAEQGEVS